MKREIEKENKNDPKIYGLLDSLGENLINPDQIEDPIAKAILVEAVEEALFSQFIVDSEKKGEDCG